MFTVQCLGTVNLAKMMAWLGSTEATMKAS
jgi:hypothetical protein